MKRSLSLLLMIVLVGIFASTNESAGITIKNPLWVYIETDRVVPDGTASPYHALLIGPIGKIPKELNEFAIKMHAGDNQQLFLDRLAMLAEASPANEVLRYMREHPELTFFSGRLVPEDDKRPFVWPKGQTIVLILKDGRSFRATVIAIQQWCQTMQDERGREIGMVGCKPLWLLPSDGVTANWPALYSRDNSEVRCAVVAGFDVAGIKKGNIEHFTITTGTDAALRTTSGQ